MPEYPAVEIARMRASSATTLRHRRGSEQDYIAAGNGPEFLALS